LKKDPGEKMDLAASNPDVVKAALKHFANARTDHKDFPIQPGSARSPDRGARVQ
jgi:hypothetical protein